MAERTQIAINGRFLAQPITGVQRYAREILIALDMIAGTRRDLSFRLLTPRLEVAAPTLNFIRHETVGRLHGHAWEQLELPSHVGTDIVFCPGNTAPLKLLFGSSRVVVTVHDLSYLYFPAAYSFSFRLLYRLLIPQVMRRAQAVITVSNSEKLAISGHYPNASRRVSAIQNGGMPAGTDLQARQNNEPQFVLYVGSLSKRKNLPAMLEVATALAMKRNLKFVFVGGISASLTESVIQAPQAVREHLQFMGQVDDWATLRDLYCTATCFFFPSLYEASPLPPIEAMGCGCPVIASRIPSLVERCGDAALYCDPHSVGDMVEKVELLLDDPGLQRRLRADGYVRASTFTWDKCAGKTLQILLGQATPPSQGAAN